MPPTTKKLLESLGGALMSVLVGVNIAGDALVHLFTEATGDATKVLLNTLLRSPDDHFNQGIHELLFIHSLHSDIVSTDSSHKIIHLFLFIKLRFIRFLIISSPLIILILLEVKVKVPPVVITLPSKTILIVFLIPITIITTITVSSAIKHSLLLFEEFSLPLGVRGSVIRFSSVSLCSCTLLAPVFDDFNLERCVPGMPTTLATDAEPTDALVIGYFATVFYSDILCCLIDFVAILAHACASLDLAYDQLASSADVAVSSLVLFLLVSLSGSISLLLVLSLLCHLSYYGFICLLIRISSGCIRLSSDCDGLIVCSGSINSLSVLLTMGTVRYYE